jgi:ketosteroid isomerase-like protein
MTMTRRTLAVALSVITAMGLSGVARAESDDAAAVKGALEALRQAMLAGDKVKLVSLTADQLSYGHSSGKLETKTEFIDVIANKKTVYKMLEFTEIVVTVVGTTAILRHNWNGISVSDGKENVSKIGVLQAWTKVGQDWKLLGRQAFKI